MLMRLWGVRHVRYWWFRVRLARHVAECHRDGLGFHPHPLDLEHLDALWRGEKKEGHAMIKTRVPEAERVAFGLRIEAIRSRRKITQRWLAREAGLTGAAVSYLEAGKVCPNAATLARLADVLGVTMDELWRGLDRGGSPW